MLDPRPLAPLSPGNRFQVLKAFQEQLLAFRDEIHAGSLSDKGLEKRLHLLRGSALELGVRSLATDCLLLERRINQGKPLNGAECTLLSRSLGTTLEAVERELLRLDGMS